MILSSLTSVPKATIFEKLIRQTSIGNARSGFNLATPYRNNHINPSTSPFAQQAPSAAEHHLVTSGGKCSCDGHRVEGGEGTCCGSCGVVIEDHKLVSLSHEKATHALDDATTRADEPDRIPDLFKVGVIETAAEAGRRHMRAVGGSNVGRRDAKRQKLGCVQEKMKRQATHVYKSGIGSDPALDNRVRALQIALQVVFDAIGKVDETLQTHLRQQGARLLEVSCAHDKICSDLDCEISISSVPSGVLAVNVVRVLTERLVLTHGTPEFALVGSGLSKNDLMVVIDRVSQIPLRDSSGVRSTTTRVALQQLQTLSDPLVPCSSPSPAAAAAAAPTTTTTTTARGVAGDDDATPALVAVTADGCTFMVRNAVWSAASLGAASATRRDQALRALAAPAVAGFLRSSNCHPDVSGVALLLAVSASASSGPLGSTTQLESLLTRATSITQTSARVAHDSIAALRALLPGAAPPADAPTDDDALM